MGLKEVIKVIPRNYINDSRGSFLKIITGKEDFLPKHTGEFYLTESINGIAKGGHYHNKANEWFTLIYGKCTLCLCDIITKEVIYLELLSSHPQTIYVPNKIAHVFYNKSNCEFGLVAYSDELYDPLDTIIYEFMELLK
jgi:dTDP-4-dehydrorhamnose 3,5-epimerase-like enzyme